MSSRKQRRPDTWRRRAKCSMERMARIRKAIAEEEQREAYEEAVRQREKKRPPSTRQMWRMLNGLEPGEE